jgi:phage portal protein BeeE
MGLLDRVSAEVAKPPRVIEPTRVIAPAQAKAFVQPPFWSLADAPFYDPGQPAEEHIGNDFEAYIQEAFKANGIVFACVVARQWVFSQGRFQWQAFTNNGRRGDFFGTPELDLLDRPWPGGTTASLLSRMEQDGSLAGNGYFTTADNDGKLGRAATGEGRRIARMRPDWVTLVIGSRSGNPYALDSRVVGLLYEPPDHGQNTSARRLLLPNEVAHYAPIPDPAARFRGMSWLTPILREIEADIAATDHKASLMRNSAVSNLVVKFDKETGEDEYEEFVEEFTAQHTGSWNAYKTIFLMGGADIAPLTMNMKDLDFKNLQGGGETRVALASRVPAVLLGISEGLAGSSLNQGNYMAARRQFGDGAMRTLWDIGATALETLLTPPRRRVFLAFDGRDVPFLREDRGDAANIQHTLATTIQAYISAGYKPDAAVKAVRDEDLSALIGQHTGMVSVQMQPIIPAVEPPADPAALPPGNSNDQPALPPGGGNDA